MSAVLPRALLVAAGLFAAAAAWADSSKPVGVELFTSQGCSSCPPADRILGHLADREDVIALGFHVNYWDRLGWPDPFATEAGTERQYAYSPVLGRRNVYTPQMVIDGRYDVVGFDAERIKVAIAQAEATSASRLAVGLEWRDPGRLVYSLPAGEGAAHVRLVIVEIGQWDGAAMAGEIDVDTGQDAAGGVALLVQDSGTMRMMGAAKLTF